MTIVDRYEKQWVDYGNGPDCRMVKEEDGDWVSYEDYAAVFAENANLKRLIEETVKMLKEQEGAEAAAMWALQILIGKEATDQFFKEQSEKHEAL
jgi:hypothetical protein